MEETASREIPSSAASSGRLHALDHLRAVAMFLGVLLHAAIPYMTVWSPWHVRDENPHEAFDVMVSVIHGFRMQLFFLLAGFFARLVYLRLGPRGFLRHRLKRIGVPFVVGLLTLIPLFFVIWSWALFLDPDPRVIEKLESPGTPLDYPTAHLWFLEFLLAYCVLAVRWGRWEEQLDRRGKLVRMDRAHAWLFARSWKPLPLALASAPFFIGSPIYGEVEDAGLRLLPRFAALGYYGVFFAFGWWLQRNRNSLAEFQRFRWAYLVFAVPAWIGFAMSEVLIESGTDDRFWVGSLGLICLNLYTWLMIFSVTGLFMRFFSAPGLWTGYLADASYWSYLVHLPIVCFFQVVVRNWPASAAVKFIAVNVMTVLLLLASYHWMVRHTLIGRVLNGPRTK